MYQEALQIYRQVGTKSGIATATHNMAITLAEEGELVEAKKMFEESVARNREIGLNAPIPNTMNNMAELLLLQGEAAAANKMLEQALHIATENNQKRVMAAAHKIQAHLALDQGSAAEAEKLARATIQESHVAGIPQFEADASYVLGRSLLNQGRVTEAQAALENGNKLKQTALGLEAKVLAARIQDVSGKHAQALRTLRSAIAKEKKTDMRYKFEARLALGEIEIHSGNAAGGRAHLAALEKDATARGFGGIARQAHKLLQ